MRPLVQLMVDYHACKWPSPLTNGGDQLAQRFDSLNEPALSNLDCILEMDEDDTGERPPLITFSHFLPIQVASESHVSPLIFLRGTQLSALHMQAGSSFHPWTTVFVPCHQSLPEASFLPSDGTYLCLMQLIYLSS